jgi:hypothetical protein
MFAFMVSGGNLIRPKENKIARNLICTGVSSRYRLAVNKRTCRMNGIAYMTLTYMSNEHTR